MFLLKEDCGKICTYKAVFVALVLFSQAPRQSRGNKNCNTLRVNNGQPTLYLPVNIYFNPEGGLVYQKVCLLFCNNTSWSNKTDYICL